MEKNKKIFEQWESEHMQELEKAAKKNHRSLEYVRAGMHYAYISGCESNEPFENSCPHLSSLDYDNPLRVLGKDAYELEHQSRWRPPKSTG